MSHNDPYLKSRALRNFCLTLACLVLTGIALMASMR